MKKLSTKLITLSLAIFLFIISTTMSQKFLIGGIAWAIEYYAHVYLPLPALLIFLVGWIMSFFEKDK